MVLKKFTMYLLILLVVLLPVLGVDAAKKKTTTKKTTTTTSTTVAGKKVKFYIFYGSTCGYCQRLHNYVAELEKDPTINYMFEVVDYEVWGNYNNSELMKRVADSLNYNVTGVPTYIIGEKIFSGYSERYNNTIREAIEEAYQNKNTKDVVLPIIEEMIEENQ